MFKIYKNYLKFKLESKLKDRLIQHIEEQNYNSNKIEFEKQKVYDPSKHRYGETRFNKDKEQRIKYFHGEYVALKNKIEELREALRLVNNL